MNIEEFVTLTL